MSLLSGQVFYLDFDGALGLTYDGPVFVENIDIAAFLAPDDLAGLEMDLIQSILTSVNITFAPLGVTITTIHPEAGIDHSTIYVGGDNSEFSLYGSFLSLSEQVDIGNRDKNDIAFVFSEQISEFGLNAETYAAALTEVIVHEARHLLGYEHVTGDRTGLNGVAAVSPQGIPLWEPQGPAPFTGRFVNDNFLRNPSDGVGAIQAVVADPDRVNVVYVGTVNGGVWKTETANTPNPIWTPQTDQFPSLSIGALVFDTADTTHQTLYAGIGRASSAGGQGGPLIGLLKGTNGGSRWELVGRETFNDTAITNIVAHGNVILVATELGPLFRSDDFGETFKRIDELPNNGLPAGRYNVTALVADPQNPNQLYLGIPTKGIFRSDNRGETWSPVNSDIAANDISASSRVGIAVHHQVNPQTNQDTHAVYAGFIYFDPAKRQMQLMGMYRSENFGVSWKAMSLPSSSETASDGVDNDRDLVSTDADEQGFFGQSTATFFSIIADPVDSHVVYVGGNSQPQTQSNSVGLLNNAARLFRGDARKTLPEQWEQIVGVPANATAPHADSRNMVFDASKRNLLEVDDGGIYRLENPGTPGSSRKWVSLNGNLQITEFHSIAYDPINHTILGGAQDNATPVQKARGSTTWAFFGAGDGGIAQVDASGASPVYFFSSQQLKTFGRVTVDGVDDARSIPTLRDYEDPSEWTLIPLIVNGTGGLSLPKFDVGVQFIQPYALNAVDPRRILFGTLSLYESMDQGDTLTALGGVLEKSGRIHT